MRAVQVDSRQLLQYLLLKAKARKVVQRAQGAQSIDYVTLFVLFQSSIL